MALEYIERIKEKKKEKGINTDKLSELTGIPVGTLSKILSGVSDSVKLSNIASICQALDVSLDWLVFGIPENHNNYTLSAEEISMIEDFRTLDVYSRELIRSNVRIEHSRAMQQAVREAEDKTVSQRRAAILTAGLSESRTSGAASVRRERRSIDLFDLAVSAGTGEYLDSTSAGASISIPADNRTAKADFAVRINGDSMEPKFRNEDILLVERTDSIEVGDLGIFTLDGCGFFKIFGGDHLKSINPKYADILLKDFTSIVCCGRVIGKVKKSTARM